MHPSRQMILSTILVSSLGLVAAGTVRNFTMSDITKLESEDRRTREAAARELLQERGQLIKELQRIVKHYISDPQRKGTTKTAIILLGNLRAVECVPLLAENLTFFVFYKDVKRPQTIEDRFPCVGALIEIGIPCLDPVLETVQNSDDETVIRSGAYVVSRIVGPELALALIHKRMEGEKDASRQKRLSRMQQYVESRFK